MTNSGAASPKGLTRALDWARKAPAKRVGGPIAGLALVVSGAFGGLDAATPQAPVLKADHAVTTGPLKVTFLRARAVDTLKPFASPEDGNRFLILIFKVRNVTDLPVFSLQVLGRDLGVKPDGVDVAKDSLRRVISATDLSHITEFQPDLDYEAAVVVETEGQTVPDEVEVKVPGYEWREGLGAANQYDWRGMKVVAQGTFPVTELRSGTKGDGDE